MDLAAVMDQVAARLRLIPTLKSRTFAYPPDKVTPPAAIVTYPDNLDPHGTYNRGVARMTLPVVVVVGRVTVRTARNELAAYVDDSGPSSVIATLESGSYTAFDTVTVTGITFDVVTIAGTDYIAALFALDISGPGR